MDDLLQPAAMRWDAAGDCASGENPDVAGRAKPDLVQNGLPRFFNGTIISIQ